MDWKEIAIAVTAYCAVVACLVFYHHKFRLWDSPPKVPECFGEMPPNPQHQAEYDCCHCPHEAECFFKSNRRRP